MRKSPVTRKGEMHEQLKQRPANPKQGHQAVPDHPYDFREPSDEIVDRAVRDLRRQLAKIMGPKQG